MKKCQQVKTVVASVLHTKIKDVKKKIEFHQITMACTLCFVSQFNRCTVGFKVWDEFRVNNIFLWSSSYSFCSFLSHFYPCFQTFSSLVPLASGQRIPGEKIQVNCDKWVHKQLWTKVWSMNLCTLSTLALVLAEVSTYWTPHSSAFTRASSTDTCLRSSKSDLFPTNRRGILSSSALTRKICSLQIEKRLGFDIFNSFMGKIQYKPQ